MGAETTDSGVAQGQDALSTQQARDRIRLQIWPEARIAENPETVAMPVLPGAAAVVCVDFADRVESVTMAQLKRWGLDMGRAFALGMHNVMALSVTKEEIEGPLGATIHVYSSEAPYVAVRALAMERWVSSPHGALVAMPGSHHLIFHPIEDGRAMGAMQAIWMLAQPAFREGPDPIQPDLYWWTPGRFMRIQVEPDPDTGNLAIQPPVEFRDVIDALMAADLDEPA